jgi:putative N6-adenine-specific DNA methylase
MASASAFVRGFGDFLKQRCTGSTAYVYFGDRELIKSVGLRPAFKRPLANGGLDGRLVKLEMFEGKAAKPN